MNGDMANAFNESYSDEYYYQEYRSDLDKAEWKAEFIKTIEEEINTTEEKFHRLLTELNNLKK